MIKSNQKSIQKEHLNQKQDYSEKVCIESKTEHSNRKQGLLEQACNPEARKSRNISTFFSPLQL
jgi:hypothetical protein